MEEWLVKMASCYDVYYVFPCLEEDEANILNLMGSLKCVDERVSYVYNDKCVYIGFVANALVLSLLENTVL